VCSAAAGARAAVTPCMTLYLGVVEYVADVADVVAVVRRDVDADGNAWLGD